MAARWVASLGALALIAVGMLVCWFYFFWCWGAYDPPDVTPMPFAPAAWKRADRIENHRTVRSQMVDDLMRWRLLDGLSRAEVEQLLGPPVTDLRQAGIDEARWHIAYRIGLERRGAWSLDYEYLVMRFDEQGRVVEYRTVVD